MSAPVPDLVVSAVVELGVHGIDVATPEHCRIARNRWAAGGCPNCARPVDGRDPAIGELVRVCRRCAPIYIDEGRERGLGLIDSRGGAPRDAAIRRAFLLAAIACRVHR